MQFQSFQKNIISDPPRNYSACPIGEPKFTLINQLLTRWDTWASHQVEIRSFRGLYHFSVFCRLCTHSDSDQKVISLRLTWLFPWEHWVTRLSLKQNQLFSEYNWFQTKSRRSPPLLVSARKWFFFGGVGKLGHCESGGAMNTPLSYC